MQEGISRGSLRIVRRGRDRIRHRGQWPRRELEADDASEIGDASALAFRAFADSTGADRRALAAIQRAATPIAKTRLDAITVPTMVIAGDEDDLVGSPQLLADRIPGAVARLVKGTHLGAVADPAFAAAIVAFVTSVPSA